MVTDGEVRFNPSDSDCIQGEYVEKIWYIRQLLALPHGLTDYNQLLNAFKQMGKMHQI